MATNASKLVLTRFLDTWSRGPRLLPYLTDLGPVKKKGDSCDIPTRANSTVNTGESASPATVSESADTLTVNRTKFVNDAITHANATLLLDGGYVPAVQEPALMSLINATERDMIEHLIQADAGAAATNHINLAADALDATDGPTARKTLVQQDGVIADRGIVFASPSAIAAMSSLATYVEVASPRKDGEIGVQVVRSFCGFPVIEHNGIPGDTNPIAVAFSASAITSGTWVLTVPSGHGFVVGQRVYTTGATANVAKASAVQVTAVTATTVTFVSGSSTDGSNGAGTLYSASGMALFVYGPWAFYASDSIGRSPAEPGDVLMPDMKVVDRSDAAGMALKVVLQFGRAFHSGACKVLHTPL